MSILKNVNYPDKFYKNHTMYTESNNSSEATSEKITSLMIALKGLGGVIDVPSSKIPLSCLIGNCN